MVEEDFSLKKAIFILASLSVHQFIVALLLAPHFCNSNSCANVVYFTQLLNFPKLLVTRLNFQGFSSVSEQVPVKALAEHLGERHSVHSIFNAVEFVVRVFVVPKYMTARLQKRKIYLMGE